MNIGFGRLFIGCILLLAGTANYLTNNQIDCTKMNDKEQTPWCIAFQDQNYYTIKAIPIILGAVFVALSFINPSEETTIKDRTSKLPITFGEDRQ